MSKKSFTYRNNSLNNDLGVKLDILFHIKQNLGCGKALRAVCSETVRAYKLDKSPEALRKAFIRFEKNGEKIDARCDLDAASEVLLVKILEAFSLVNRPLDRATFLQHAGKLMNKSTDWNGSSWFSNFLKRHHNQITTTTAKALKNSATKHSVLTAVKQFVSDFEKTIDKYNISSNEIVNCDETRISFNPNQMKLKAIESKSKPMFAIRVPEKNIGATYIPFITHNSIILQVIIFPHKSGKGIKTNIPDALKRKFRHDIPTFYTTTESGYANEQIWIKIMNEFAKVTKNKFQNKTCMLLMDNLPCHSTYQVVKQCIDNNIVVIGLPADTTHYLQPLDSTPFQQVKKYCRNHFRKLLIGSSKTRSPSLSVMEELNNMVESISTAQIQKGWRETGIIPWNKDLIINMAKKSIGVGSIKSNFDKVANTFKDIISGTIAAKANTYPIPDVQNQLLSPEAFHQEMLKEKERIDQLPKDDPPPKKRSRGKEKLAPQKKPRKQESKKNHCSYPFHLPKNNALTGSTTAWEECPNKCGFKMCKRCYHLYTEFFGRHQSDCDELMKSVKPTRGMRMKLKSV